MDEAEATVGDGVAVDEETRKQAVQAVLQGVVSRLSREADNRVGKRKLIEDRWIRNLEQYQGQYDAVTRSKLKSSEKSQLFINLTRPKTDAMVARLADMLFPTDDRNWGIQSTPVPELVEEVRKLTAKFDKAATNLQGASDQERAPREAEMDAIKAKLEEVRAVTDEAARRCNLMQDEMEDQLAECRYNIQCRDVIDDACKLGTGVLKGPVLADKPVKRWRQDPKANAYVLREVADVRPHFTRVDPWSFFPDPAGRSMEDSEGEFERHLMTKDDLRRLAKRPGFNQDAIRRLLKGTPRTTVPSYLADLRNITQDQDADMSRFQVWEYHGVLEPEEYEQLALATEQPELLSPAGDVDPLEVPYATVWFCEGELLSFAAHPMDSGESIYSVFTLAKDAASIFGFGIPEIMSDPQRALNAGWRMMLDNSGLTAGPQIVINREYVEPADGDWTMKPMKVWIAKALPENAPADHAFKVYNIDSHQAELAGIIQLARQFVDEETAIPMLAQGDQGQNVTKTLGGMSILMNSANVVLRRIVKNWDDDMTVPNIRRLYHWNMQHSQKEELKGDMEVDARGTSVLLVRELQAQNLMNMLALFTTNPALMPLANVVEMAKSLIKAQQLNPDRLLFSEEQIRQMQADAKAAGAEQQDPEIMKLTVSLNIAEIEAESRREVALLNRETALISLAAKGNMDMEQLKAQLDSKERLFTAEAAMTPVAGTPGAEGSGGYFSTKTSQPAAAPPGGP